MYSAISPRDNVAGLLDEQNHIVRTLDSAHIMSPERYLSMYPDTSLLEASNESHARELLAKRSSMSMCLDMTLLLFDDDISIETRQEVAAELDVLLQQQDHYNYVLDIVFCKALPSSADISGATRAIRSSVTTKRLVSSIIDCQDRVQLTFEAWLRVGQDRIVKDAGSDRVFALLCRHGVFRRLATEATDARRLEAIKSNLVIDAQLTSQLDSAPRIIMRIASELSGKLPKGQPTRLGVEGDLEADSHQSYQHEQQDDSPIHASAHAAYVAAISQVERIAELYGELKDTQAKGMLDQLLAEQSKYAPSDGYIVKSLCNIASKVHARGRPEVSLDCLRHALTFQGGIDSRLYFQIGNELRELRQFDEATQCYLKAKQLDDGSLASRLELALIRVTVARGDYNEALNEFLAIPDLQYKPSELNGLGTLYRRMGRMQDARERYRQCLKVDEKFHAAHAGLAEVKKQSGKPHDAIAGYNSLMRRFTDLEVGSRKVYELARSHLFRLTKQYKKSGSILSGLAAEFPGDRDVLLQYAKLLALRGDTRRAQEYFGRVEGQSLFDLGRLTFAAATKAFDSTVLRSRLADIQSTLLPEDRGLASCIAACDSIAERDFERALDVVKCNSFVDRLIGDFATVLRFHALRRISKFDYKMDYSLCRIAKRSDRSLRQAVEAIQQDAYSTAEELESEFLLRVAA